MKITVQLDEKLGLIYGCDRPFFRSAVANVADGLKDVEKLLREAMVTPAVPDLSSLTPLGKKMLSVAKSWARAHGHSYVGREHLLMGLLAVTDGEHAGGLNFTGMDRSATVMRLRTLADELESGAALAQEQPAETAAA